MPPLSLPYQLTKTTLASVNEIQAKLPVPMTGFFTNYLPTTINTKRSIFATAVPGSAVPGSAGIPNDGSMPKLRYFGIGIRGMKNQGNSGPGNISAPYIPSAANMDIFTPLPFRTVLIGEDLTPTEQLQYRMKVLTHIGGNDYWCYYLKKLTVVDNSVKLIQTNLGDGEETVLNVTDLDPNNLSPTPTVTSSEGTASASSTIAALATLNMQITGEEVNESVSVIYNDPLRAKISEIGLYSGYDVSVTTNELGACAARTEAMFTQLMYHYCNNGIDFSDPSRIENNNLRITGARGFII